MIINNDKIIDYIDSIIKYEKYKHNHEFYTTTFFYLGLISLCFNLATGLLILWVTTVIKLLGYKYWILSRAERQSNHAEPIKLFSSNFFSRQFGFRNKELSENELISHRKAQMFFFFWLIPIVILTLVPSW